MTTPAFVLEAARTPIGRHGGALSGVRPDDLAALTLKELVARVPDLDPELIDDVCVGDANQAGEDNRNVARMAILLAGLPTSIPGSTTNRLCGSGMEAVFSSSRQIEVGDASVAVAGGVESMSRAPWVALKPERPFSRTDLAMSSTTLGWRLVNPLMADRWTVGLGEGAEILAERYGITREEQDEFAVRSHANADRAWSEGRLEAESFAIAGTDLERDEGIRPETSLEGLSRLKPAFRADGGTVTAGNSSQLSDGAAMLLLGDEAGAGLAGARPRARIAARAVSAVEPQHYGIGPVEAAVEALRRAGIGWSDLAVVELNEAYAAQSLACLREWPDLDPAIVNPNGGAIAVGHPLGCSGARLVTTLVNELERRGGRWGMAAMCIGVGQGVALVVEAC